MSPSNAQTNVLCSRFHHLRFPLFTHIAIDSLNARLENEMNASVPNLSTTNPNTAHLSNVLTTAQSSPNLSTPSTLDVAHVAGMDDDTVPTEEPRSLSDILLPDQQKQAATDETSEDEDFDDDEHCQLKRAKITDEQIPAPIDPNGRDFRYGDVANTVHRAFSLSHVEEDEDEDDDEEPDEEEPEQDEVSDYFRNTLD